MQSWKFWENYVTIGESKQIVQNLGGKKAQLQIAADVSRCKQFFFNTFLSIFLVIKITQKLVWYRQGKHQPATPLCQSPVEWK